MSKMLNVDVVIIGGGLVGAAMALSLQQQQKRVALLEIRPATTDKSALLNNWDARIFAISPANQAFLQDLNAWPDASRVQTVSNMCVMGDNQGQIEFTSKDTDSNNLTYIVENRWLLASIWQQFDENWITVLPERATSIQTDMNQATVVLESGLTLHSKLIIGADGAHSWVREQAKIKTIADPYHHFGVVANFHAQKPHHGTAYQWFKNGEVLAYLPMPDNNISIVWSTSEPERLLSLSSQELAGAVAEQGEHMLGDLECISPAHAFELVLRRPETTIGTRLALIGDAAHTIHPLAGQGVNLGFGDVIELSKILSRATTNLGAQQQLQQYHQNRLASVRTMQLGCDGLFHLFANQQVPGISQVRNLGLSLVNKLPWFKTQLIRHAMGI